MKTRFLLVTCICFIIGIPISRQVNSQSTQDDFWSKLNPAFSGANFVMDKESCNSCHQDVITTYEKTVHSHVFLNNPGNNLEKADCESCHGPRSIHIENPDNRFAFSEDQYTAVCSQCHQGGSQMYWHNSMHNTANVGCISCHSVMEKRSNIALLSKPTQLALCSTCHSEVSSKLMRASHHPVQEGKMDCSSCHNVHGTPTPGMLIGGTVNENCYSCHQDKRGPFVWEHPPVRDDCLSCHEPHGSNNRSLLITQNASLCISCHQYGGHINQYRYNRVSTPYGNGCVNCHMTIHGSNHPSGVKFTR